MAGHLEEFYSNDIVYRFDKRKRIIFGIVTESYEASSDVDDFDNLAKGEIRVWWSSSSREQIWKQNKVRLLNRSIIPGDVVRRFIQGQETQRGYCKISKELVTLQIVGTDKVVEKVCSARLKPVSKYTFDKTVCLDNKFGRIQNVENKVVMLAKCGSCVELSHCSSSQASLDDFWLSKRNRWYPGAYYPGQEIVCVPQYLHNAVWTHRSKTMKRRMQSRMRFTIQSVEVESIDVVWYSPSDLEQGEMNKCTIKGEDIKRLKILDSPESHILDLAERLFLKLSSSDKLVRKQDWLRKQSALYRPDLHKTAPRHVLNRNGSFDDNAESSNTEKFRRSSTNVPLSPPAAVSDSEEWWTDDGISDHGSSSSFASSGRRSKSRHWPPRPREIVPGNTLAVEVLCFESKITVVWQDGTIEEDIPSTQLYYSMSLDDHEFFPGEWVVGEGNQNGDEYGAIQCVNHLERTAKVKWFRLYNKEKCITEYGNEPVYLHTSELSVYDLQKHQKYQFRPGSIVYPIQNTKDSNSESKMGHVLDSYPEGFVSVRWMDGIESNCWPQDLMLLPEAEYDILTETSTEYQPGSWETESEISVEGDTGQDDLGLALIATKLDFIRNKMVYLKDVFKQHPTDNILQMRDLLIMYDNSSYLDKLLGTSFFNRKSYHFRMLLEQVRNRAKEQGIELSGRLFSASGDAPLPSLKAKEAEKENMEKVISMESSLNAQLSQSQSTESFVSASAEIDHGASSDGNLCLELLTMLKMRMDLAYGEIASRLGFPDALTVMTKASEGTPVPTVPTTPEEVIEKPLRLMRQPSSGEGFMILDEAPKSHHFYGTTTTPTNTTSFYKAVRRESKLLEESLPPGVWVRGYSDRLDLLSVMIRGPSKTPYEDGLFLFDLQLGSDYPHSPPSCHFISFSSERLNPNLYVEGKVCVSLLGTWVGKGSEVWGPSSSLLQLIVSIQGLILVSEPYYNEAGYEKQVESQQGNENSRTYNELVILKLVQAMTVLSISPPEVFKAEIMAHFAQNGQKFCERIEKWTSKTEPHCPDFSLLPVSKGFMLSLECALVSFKEICGNVLEEYNKQQKENENKEIIEVKL